MLDLSGLGVFRAITADFADVFHRFARLQGSIDTVHSQITQIRQAQVATQDDVNALTTEVADVQTKVDAIQQALVDALAAHPDLDLSALKGAVDALDTDVTPVAPAPVEPVPVEAPVAPPA